MIHMRIASIVVLSFLTLAGMTFRHRPVANVPVETVLYTFQGGCDGAMPLAGLLEDRYGDFYGTTFAGGCNSGSSGNNGVVYKLTRMGTGYTESVLFSFPSCNQAGGCQPTAPLVEDASGDLYGTTLEGGSKMPAGVAFELVPGSPTYTENVLTQFLATKSSGGYPYAGLLPGPHGDTDYLFGTTSAGGKCGGNGTAFELHPPNHTLRILYEFGCAPDGGAPVASLIADPNGALYGTTERGGAHGYGTVFKLTPRRPLHPETVLYSFRGGTDGAYPEGALLLSSTGALFGTTKLGGAANEGTVFELKPAPSGYTEQLLYSFTGGNDGAQPVSSVAMGKLGAIYGTTSAGGGAGAGTVFRLTPSKGAYVESILHAFRGGSDGANPVAPVLLINDVLYGTTSAGGAPCGCGTVFKVTQ